MLELKNITKTYPAGGEPVEALKGISLKFRENEFVSILGPSGCGKTTMLNIIGGLDQYTSGDLVINGRSTKDYRDRDWDAYRNHSIGFVFQSYNLIPHQSVLQNVELALTLSGVGKAERRRRAKEALEQVGLGNQLRKKPGEMSGGQMQRVAIARAIVNNPDIILADEPTGALDTETSVQVMEILKEIAKDHLVIMVTHNPELAETYSTRIVKMLDGRILSDSMPISEVEGQGFAAASSQKAESGRKKPSMSFATAFGLSLKNLFTKKGRTALTSFAGSIGIIGIALIYAVSQGMTGFINSVQEETLSSYPLTIEASHLDSASLLSSFMGKAHSTSEHENDAIYQKAMIYEMMNALNSLDEQNNDLQAFKEYLEAQRAEDGSKLSSALSGVQYSYDPELLIYTENVDGDIIRSDTQALMTQIMRDYAGMDMSSMLALREQTNFGSTDSMMASSVALWRELVPGENGKLVNDVTEKQYELIYGSWPTRYDEIVLFTDRNNELNDLTLYALGLKSSEEITRLMQAALEHSTVDYEVQQWSYEEICAMDFRTILNADCYTWDKNSGTYTDLRETSAGMKYLYDNGMRLHVVGIVKPNEDAVAATENGAIGYTHKLTEYVLTHAEESAAVKAQQADPGTDVFTGLPFRNVGTALDEASKAAEFRAYLAALDDAGRLRAYLQIKAIPDEAAVAQAVQETVSAMSREEMETTLTQVMAAQTGMGEADVRDYVLAMEEDELDAMLSQIVAEQFKAQYAAEVSAQMAAMPPEQLLAGLEADLAAYTDAECAALYEEILLFSESSYEQNLTRLGCVDLDSPTSINLYAASFADKDLIEEAIADYNETVDDLQEIRYTDYVGLMMSSVTTIINAITYVLIAFVAVSLVVSSIMIGVITLISVQERTKEIGVLRAIGASKRNVSSMFNAETVIIGFASGILGVGITYLLCIPINLILHHLTGLNNLNAFLPPQAAFILVLLSMLLTLIAGIIPSRSAANKDPVVALRTE